MTTATLELNPEQLAMKQGLAFTAYGGLVSMGMSHLGVQLGLYEAMAGRGAISSEEVAANTGMRERFVREWLMQQTAAGRQSQVPVQTGR